MRITLAPMIINICSIFLHIALCFIYTRVADMGVYGIALAASSKDFALWLSITIYSFSAKQIRRALAPIDSSAFRGWCTYLKISVPATVMICAEWWAFEVLIVVAGTLGVASLAASTILMSINATLFMIPLGI